MESPDGTGKRSSLRELLRRRLLLPVVDLLKQGVTPEKIALSLAFGATLSCCPIIGVTTGLCALAAIVFRLNHVAIQLVNYLAYPLQLALIIPFWRLGARVFDAQPVPLSPVEVAALFRADFIGSSARYGLTALRGAAVWALLAPAAIFLVQRLLLAGLRRINERRRR